MPDTRYRIADCLAMAINVLPLSIYHINFVWELNTEKQHDTENGTQL